MTKYFDFKKEMKDEDIKKIVDILKSDGLIIFPTETVYGIGCNALSNKAIKRIYKVKERNLNKHLNIFVSDAKEIEKYACIKSIKERELIRKYMPGAITIIFEKKKSFKSIAFDDDTIGIRIPDNQIMLEILKRIPFPLASTSANISGKESNLDVSSLMKDFDGKVDAIIDGGKASIGIASTIVEVKNEKIIILREGSIKDFH